MQDALQKTSHRLNQYIKTASLLRQLQYSHGYSVTYTTAIAPTYSSTSGSFNHTRTWPSQQIRCQHSHTRGRNGDLDRDFILSILQAQPSARDSRSYLKAFASEDLQKAKGKPNLLDLKRAQHAQDQSTATPLEFRDAPKDISETELQAALLAKKDTEIVEALLNPVTKHTALVKVQGPFSPRQIASIAEGLVYLERLGLVSIVVVDDESWTAGGFMGASSSHTRKEMQEAALALTEAFESIGGKACPLISNIFKLGDVSDSMNSSIDNHNGPLFHTSTCVSTLEPLRAAIARGEMPIITPIAVDSGLSAVAVPANDAIKALVASLAREGHVPPRTGSDVDLLPLRMMIINREGGIPSPARGGAPHLSINLESEFDYIQDTFVWQNTHPTSLSNLNLLRSCLFQLPRESSAVIVSHRSPKALIANLITNRPAFSPSLHYSVLPVKQIQHMPTIVRRGLPIRVIRDLKQINLDKCTRLLEASFRQTLNADSFYGRLAQDMDFIIVAGEADSDSDYQAAAIVTKERDLDDPSSNPISYLDKFAVLPSLQGDGTVDFMWTALRDETFGLGLLDALNPNGGKQGFGFGTDLVWRSRADNPVNKWYFERSNGFVHIPEMGSGGVRGTLFWCDAEDRLVRQMEASAALSNEGRASERQSISIVMKEEEGRLARWARVIGSIGSCWVHK